MKEGFAGILNAGLGGVRQIKAGIFRGGGHVLRYKGDTFYRGADALDGVANRLDPSGRQTTPPPAVQVPPRAVPLPALPPPDPQAE